MKNKNQTPDAMDFMYERYIAGHPDRISKYTEEKINVDVAIKIYQLREKAGLTQKELAKLVGTSASVIARLEESDYDGNAMAMLRQIAEALGKRVEIRLVTAKKGARNG
jgi:ribosome-binding protein aMBF1 (putative translation factor)